MHPAAMVLLGFAAVICFALRKSFCAWICPVGTLSEWVWRLGRRMMGRNIQLPAWIDIPARGFKYGLIGFFIWIIARMDAQTIFGFLQSPYYKMSDVKMLHLFTHMTALTGAVLLFLAIGSLFVRNFWCRYFCPYGALMGLLALGGPTHIQRSEDTCTGCGRCAEACHNHLPVQRKATIRSPECTGCLDCIRACPVDGTLTLKSFGRRGKRWTQGGLCLSLVLAFTLTIFVARLAGHWQTRIQIQEFQYLLYQIDTAGMIHPAIGSEPR